MSNVIAITPARRREHLMRRARRKPASGGASGCTEFKKHWNLMMRDYVKCASCGAFTRKPDAASDSER